MRTPFGNTDPALYDRIGRTYTHTRRPDPRIAAVIWDALGEAETVLNVGAGAGNYEPPDREVVAVEPSPVMIAQRAPEAARVVQARAEDLPFADDSFDVAMAILSDHHWSDRGRGLRELRRVARQRVVLFNANPSEADLFWLTTEYLPEFLELIPPRYRPPRGEGEGVGASDQRPAGPWEGGSRSDQQPAGPREGGSRSDQQPSGVWVAELRAALGASELTRVPIPHDCTDGFYGAFWRRPEAYLDPDVRAGISVFSQLSSGSVTRAIGALSADLEAGTWHETHRALLDTSELHLGYYVIAAGEQLTTGGST